MFKFVKRVWYVITYIFTALNVRHVYFERYKSNYKKSKIDWKRPVIFVSNHQSAFMDPVIVSSYLPKRPYYLMRADVFKNPVAAKVLPIYQLMPVYRQRDGVENLQKNEAIFRKCFDILNANEALILFPEGNQLHRWGLRSLKKGIARIAFGAAEHFDYSKSIQIVPLGINYGNHFDTPRDLYVNFGEVMELEPYYESYKNSKAETINRFLKDLHGRMEQLVYNFAVNNDTYDLMATLKDIYVPYHLSALGIDSKGQKGEFEATVSLTKRVNEHYVGNEEEVKTLAAEVQSFQKLNQKLKINIAALAQKGNWKALASLPFYLLFLPYYLFSFVVNKPFLMLLERFVKGIKDKHWHHSVRAFGGSLLFVNYYIIHAIVAMWIIDIPVVEYAYLFFLLFSGFYYKFFNNWTGKLRSSLLLLISFGKTRKNVLALVKHYKSIVSKVDKLLLTS